MAVDIIWVDDVNCLVSGNDVSKDAGSPDTPDAWADSQVALQASGDYFEFKVPNTNKLLQVGVYISAHTGAGMHGLSFSSGVAEVRQAGDYKGETSHTGSDLFKVAIDGTTVRYYKNGAEITASSNPTVTLPVKPSVLFVASDGAVTDAVIDADAESVTVPLTYNAITDRTIRTPSVPTYPAAGGNYIDSSLGCRVYRVTDGTTGTTFSTPANYSYHTPSAPNQMASNILGTRFYVLNGSGTTHFFNLNRTTKAITPVATRSWGLEPAWSKVPARESIHYGVRFINDHVIEKFDETNTGAGYVEVLDLKDVDGTLDNTVYTSSIYTSAGAVERAVVNFGGAGQDLHFKIIMFDLNNVTDRRIINMTTNQIDGVGLVDQNGSPFTFSGVKSHSIAISRDGNFLRIDPVGTSAYFWIYDWTLNRIKKEMASTRGHYSMGWRDCINEDSDSKPQWRRRSLVLADSSTTSVRVTTPFGGVSAWGDHQAWHNASSLANSVAPFFSESQSIFGEALFAWSNQILGVQSTGAELVWRFCYHHMNPNGDISGTAAAPFKYQPGINNDPLGEYVMFTTNGNKTFGNDAGELSGESTKRCDVMIVWLSQETAPPLSIGTLGFTGLAPFLANSSLVGTLVTVTGSIYSAATGAKTTSGTLYLKPKAFIRRGNDLVAPKTVSYSIPGSGNISLPLAPSTDGVKYVVEFDPNPGDTATPMKLKPGYFYDEWTIPVTGPVDIAAL